MAKKINASNELNDLIKTTVNLAYKEGLTITELNQLITEQRKNIGMVQKKHKAKYYRDATNEELLFKSKAYMFLTEYISLDDISFEVKTNERIALIGDNGSGKTTLLNIISGIEKENSGTIRLNPQLPNVLFIKLGKIGLKEKSEFIREKLSQLG